MYHDHKTCNMAKSEGSGGASPLHNHRSVGGAAPSITGSTQLDSTNNHVVAAMERMIEQYIESQKGSDGNPL